MEIILPNTEMVTKARVYDLEEQVKASGYSMMAVIDDNPLTEKDWKRMDHLGKNPPGTGHNNPLKGVITNFDLTITNKMWIEAERYNFFVPTSCQSTMHRLCRMDLDKTVIKYVDDRTIETLKELQDKFNETGEREDFLKLVYSCPSGLLLTGRITTNYMQLKTIYLQRRNHRLPEWQTFCDWIESLPYSEWITTNKGE